MRSGLFFISIIIAFLFAGCKKNNTVSQIIPIPNGDFESWNSWPVLSDWQTNSCPLCVPPYEPYIVRKVTDAASGQYAAQFIFNGFYPGEAVNKFPVSLHPSSLQGYIKSTITGTDTARIHIDIIAGNTIVDGGDYYETSSSPAYKKIQVAVSQNYLVADSVSVMIKGGSKPNTVLFTDHFELIKD
jgi:hypothetical protein